MTRLAYHRRLPSPEAFARSVIVLGNGHDMRSYVDDGVMPWLAARVHVPLGPDLTPILPVTPPWGVLIAQDRMPLWAIWAFDIEHGAGTKTKWIVAPNPFAARCAAAQAGWEPICYHDGFPTVREVSLSALDFWKHMNAHDDFTSIDLVVLP